MTSLQFARKLLTSTQHARNATTRIPKSIFYQPTRLFTAEGGRRPKIKLKLIVLTSAAVGGYLVYREVCVATTVASEQKVKLYTLLPMNALSRVWGKVNNIDLPVWMRKPVYNLYIRTFNVNLEEASIKDLSHYSNLGEFFKRRVKSTCRPIDKTNVMVSPCDGKVLHFGRVEDGWIEQVKGVTYSLPGFLGPYTWPNTDNDYKYTRIRLDEKSLQKRMPEKEFENIIKSKDNSLYHCVLYLAPGDYHGFHSPSEWIVSMRRHFPGKLLSVNPRIARRVKGLFNLNERAVYIGEWEQGFMSMAAVGATNVGSIKVFFDEKLETNLPVKYPPGAFLDEVFARQDLGGVPLKKGEPVGEFKLGSTIVLVFEAPKEFQFKLENGQTIKYGQPLGCYKNVINNVRSS